MGGPVPSVAQVRAAIEAELVRRAGGPGRMLGARRLSRLIGFDALVDLYARYREDPAEPLERAALDLLGISWRVASGRAEDIPADGPILIVSNHPTGGAEALILAALIDARRPDRMVLGNDALSLVPELAGRQIPVDNVGRRGNAGALIAAARHLRGGGALLTFPAGTVAFARHPLAPVREAPWHPSIARLAEMARAPVLPVTIRATASPRWRRLAGLSRIGRTLLLPRELLAQRGRRIDVEIGRPLHRSEEIAALFASRS